MSEIIIEYFLDQDSRKQYFYLHGGPFFNIQKWQDDPFASMLHDCKKNLILINYPVVFGEGGTTDFLFLKSYFQKFKRHHPNSEMVLIGESYGGYLASLFANLNLFKEIIAISAFISIEYQELFSSERVWLKRFLSPQASDFFYLYKNHQIKTEILFVNGSKDLAVPSKQFLVVLNSIDKKLRINILPGYEHRETGKKLNNVISLIKQEL